MKLVHVIEKFFTSGAASSLKQIYDALSDSSVVTSQKVICLKSSGSSKPTPSWFPVPVTTYSYLEFSDITKASEYENAVFVFHKLMCSPVKIISNLLLKTQRPNFVINHTYSDHSAFNRLYNFNACVSVSEHMSNKMRLYNKGLQSFVVRNIVDHDYASQFISDNKDSSYFKSGRINALNDIKYNADFVRWICNLNIGKRHMHEYIGGGQYLAQATSICDSSTNPYSKCIMLGSVNDDVKKFGKIKSWDIFLYHINRPEGTSMSVLESLASGIPVVCSNHPGNNELIKNGINGFVFDDFSEAEKTLKMLASDNQKLLDIRSSTIDWARNNLTKQKLKENYEAVIQEIVKSPLKIAKKPHHIISKLKDNTNKQLIYKNDNPKKIIQDRLAQRSSHQRSRSLRPVKKKVLGSTLLQKQELVGQSKQERKTYVPIILASEIVDYKFTSEYIGVRGINVGVDFCYGDIDFKSIGENEYIILDVNNFLLIKLPLSDNLVPKNSEIIFIDNHNLNHIKTL